MQANQRPTYPRNKQPNSQNKLNSNLKRYKPLISPSPRSKKLNIDKFLNGYFF